MINHACADGSVIEIGGGNTHPPGWTGQHGNVNRDWVRKPGCEWVPSPERSRHRLMEWVEAAETADELIEAITWSGREMILCEPMRPCMACGKPTGRYVILDWNWSCGPDCDAILDRRLAEDLDECNRRQDRDPADEDDLCF